MNKAIVICYTGKEPDSDTVCGIHQAIESYCNGEGITIKVFDSDSIAKTLLKKAAEDVQTSTNDEKVIESARTEAIKLIKFNYSGIDGVVKLVRDLGVAKYHHRVNALDDNEKKLLDAIDVIMDIPQKTLNARLSKTLRETIFKMKDM